MCLSLTPTPDWLSKISFSLACICLTTIYLGVMFFEISCLAFTGLLESIKWCLISFGKIAAKISWHTGWHIGAFPFSLLPGLWASLSPNAFKCSSYTLHSLLYAFQLRDNPFLKISLILSSELCSLLWNFCWVLNLGYSLEMLFLCSNSCSDSLQHLFAIPCVFLLFPLMAWSARLARSGRRRHQAQCWLPWAVPPVCAVSWLGSGDLVLGVPSTFLDWTLDMVCKNLWRLQCCHLLQ